MLNVQKYLRAGNNIENLACEFGIKTVYHPIFPIAILNYDQIESKPKSHPIIRECRALVLDTTTWDIVARSFSRFFNWGEMVEETDDFDFSNFIVQSKEDGSLVSLYYYNNEWHGNTRGSFGLDNMQNQSFSWRIGFLKALGLKSYDEMKDWFDPELTYVCEFCSPWNKVVRRYDAPQMFLLTIFRKHQELTPREVDQELARLQQVKPINLQRPNRYEFHSIDEIQKFLNEQTAADPTFEGVVICDIHGHRWKIKNASYLALHRLKGEGDNLFNPKNLIPFALSGEKDEIATYFPEVLETLNKLEEQIKQWYAELLNLFRQYKDIEDQKEFALKVKDSPFSGILFTLRKQFGKNQTEQHLRDIWKNSGDKILKHVKL